MATIHTVTKTLGAPVTIQNVQTFEASGSSEINGETIATGETAFLINWAFPVSGLKSVFLLSDKTITIKTNSSGAPDNTITLTANIPLEWQTGGPYTNLFTAAVTKIYVANASGATATLYAAALFDATP